MENDRKIYEQLYGVTGQAKTRRPSRSGRDQEEIYSVGGDRSGAGKKGTKKRQEKSAELEQRTMEQPYVIYPDYEPKYVSALNLRERPTVAMHMQYQHQHVMPSYVDYYYYDRGYGPAAVAGGPQIYPGVSQHGKWASDHDISGTLKRMKKSEREKQEGRKGEFRFNPALFNGQMFRNINMRYSTESGTTSSGDEVEEAQIMIGSHSEESVDQVSLNVDDSALVNFMRANNEIVNHEFENDDDEAQPNRTGPALATRTTNIRYVTKVYVPRKLQQRGGENADDEESRRPDRGGARRPSLIPQRQVPGDGPMDDGIERKKSVSSDSFFSELEKIDIDEEQNQYEMQKRCIEEHLEMLKEHSIKDYDSHDRKKLLRSNSHSTVMDGSGAAAAKSKLPVNRRLSLMAKPDLVASRKMVDDMNNKLKLNAPNDNVRETKDKDAERK